MRREPAGVGAGDAVGDRRAAPLDVELDGTGARPAPLEHGLPAAQLARSFKGVRQRAGEEAPSRLPALLAPDRFHDRPTPLPWLATIISRPEFVLILSLRTGKAVVRPIT
jgi:hypothetical protein